MNQHNHEVAFLRHIRVIVENNLFLQTLYSLPWLLVGVLYVYLQHPEIFWTQFSLKAPVALCAAFLSARFSGMSWNRLLDAALDAQNARTKNRLLPAKRASTIEVAFHALLFLGLFFIATTYLPKSCQQLAIPVGLLLIFYSLTKRFTSFCHLTLGSIYFLVPFSAAFAFGGSFSFPLLGLSLAAGLVVTGCDVLYACQDMDFDRRLHLRSIPADHGIDFSVRYASGCHLVAAMLLIGVLYQMHIHAISWAVFAFGCTLIYTRWKMIFIPSSQCVDQGVDPVASHFPYLAQLSGVCAVSPFVVEVMWRVLS